MGNITSGKKFTQDDITKMRDENVQFIIYKNGIYGMNHLIDFSHPAGSSLVKDNIGKDITKHMEFHSTKALILMKKNYWGTIV